MRRVVLWGQETLEREVQVLYFKMLDFVYSYYWIVEIILLAVFGMSLAGNWLVFEKMDEPGWKGIVPFYNLYVLFDKLYGNGLYALVYLIAFVPLVGSLVAFVVHAFTQYRLSQSFRKDIGFTVGLILCSPVFMLLLGLDRSKYCQLRPIRF